MESFFEWCSNQPPLESKCWTILSKYVTVFVSVNCWSLLCLMFCQIYLKIRGFIHIYDVHISIANNLSLHCICFAGFDISGFSSCTEARSSLTIQSLSESSNHKIAATPPTAIVGTAVGSVGGGEEEPPKKIARRASGMKEMERNMMEEMPCVSTRGEGPNGRRIEGFLYKYRKGEEVRIVCVCHGSFLTPAEFVRHAGGGDVAHPLKHIVVNPSSAAFL